MFQICLKAASTEYVTISDKAAAHPFGALACHLPVFFHFFNFSLHQRKTLPAHTTWKKFLSQYHMNNHNFRKKKPHSQLASTTADAKIDCFFFFGQALKHCNRYWYSVLPSWHLDSIGIAQLWHSDLSKLKPAWNVRGECRQAILLNQTMAQPSTPG